MQNPPSEALAAKLLLLRPRLDERARRVWAAREARALGRGGISRVAEATGLSRGTMRAGLQALARADPAAGPQTPPEQVRRRGGGRQPLRLHEPDLLHALAPLGDPGTRGAPLALRGWPCNRAAQVAAALRAPGPLVSERTGNRLRHAVGDRLQAKRQPLAGGPPPERAAPFQSRHRRAQAFQKQGQPVGAVDPKPQARGGQGRQGGREWAPPGQPEEVEGHDGPRKTGGKGIPYGI